ncbi:MarR family winged helix-turn-helix transcriptional regulator [Kineosporia sp. A_224]|uniref:MarR family winged helix-turn-helix transcriptional regulator n=1 Tax=Kineosporia sp. A_224 TaxID=1962180 RepID=UPI000B4B8987|nr:MarR family winged helix-turn-helix transcriptional regulator [Kineosporia sp. A_224]
MNSVKGPDDDHVFALLDHALRRLRADVQAHMTRAAASGRPDLPDLTTLRTSQLRLLTLTPDDGLRVGDLAARAGMTAQALGEFVRSLVRDGLLTVEPDPRDRRARVVRRTASGRAVAQAAEDGIRAMELDWAERLGADRWDAMRAVLGDVARG